MKISQRGIDLIKSFEAYRGQAYKCQAGVWTIGYGTTKVNGKKVTKGMTCTKSMAEDYLRKDLASFENSVNSLVKVEVTQSMYDALVSFTYNCGSGALKTSTLLKELNKGNYKKASEEFPKWNKVTKGLIKVVSNGLNNRRAKEKALFLSEGIPTDSNKKETVSNKVTDDSLKVGDKVKIKKGSTDYGTKKKFMNFVYLTKYDVIQISGNRVVFGKGKSVTGSVKKENLIKVD